MLTTIGPYSAHSADSGCRCREVCLWRHGIVCCNLCLLGVGWDPCLSAGASPAPPPRDFPPQATTVISTHFHTHIPIEMTLFSFHHYPTMSSAPHAAGSPRTGRGCSSSSCRLRCLCQGRRRYCLYRRGGGCRCRRRHPLGRGGLPHSQCADGVQRPRHCLPLCSRAGHTHCRYLSHIVFMQCTIPSLFVFDDCLVISFLQCWLVLLLVPEGGC